MKKCLKRAFLSLPLARLKQTLHECVKQSIILLFIISASIGQAAPQLVSIRDSSLSPAVGGNGDSGASNISADGRYVLFSSVANNLVLAGGGAMPTPLSPYLNVFLRDRTQGTTTLVSVNSTGTNGGTGDSLPAVISTNGQFILFESRADDLVPNDTNGASDIFVRDVVNNTTVLVSAAAAGGSGNGESHTPVMTPDGRNVAFVSAASNLVANDTNQIPDVFVRDLQSGTTTLVSVGAQSINSSISACGSEAPVMTPDGRYVAFYSTATNLVPGVTRAGEVYVRDLIAGTTYWASTNAQAIVQSVTGLIYSNSFNPQISTDGQFVAFIAKPKTTLYSPPGIILRYSLLTGFTDVVFTNAVAAGILDMTPDGRFITFVANWNSSSTSIYQWDSLTGTNVLVSGDLSNTISSGTSSEYPTQTPDGRFVAFFCSDTNMTAEAQGNGALYLRDMLAGSTILVDVDTNGIGAGADASATPGLSGDGQFITFQCFDRNLVPDDSSRDRNVFVRDLRNNTNEMISVHDPALPSLTPNGPSLLFGSSVSTNGRYIAFASDANNLVANDTNDCRDVFVRDLLLGTNILVSADTSGFAAANISTDPSINGDGRFVAFSSHATNIVANDTTNEWNVFLRDMQAGTTVLVSVNTNGGFGNGDSFSPTVSRDGRYVLFYSEAQNLAAGSFGSGVENLFLRDEQSGTTYALTTSTSASITPSASMTPDGRFVAYTGSVAGIGTKLFVWDSAFASIIYTNNSTSMVSISPDGQRLAYLTPYPQTPLSLNVADLSINSNWVVSAGTFLSHPGLRFSADGQFLVYATSTAGTQNVYLYDIHAGTNILVSRNSSGDSDSPDITPDGRFVAYRSFASNNIVGNFNGVPNLFLYDCSNGVTTLISLNQSGNATTNNRSTTPLFSGDGGTLVFQSAASDLVGQDFNHYSDIFSLNYIPLGTIDLANLAASFRPQIIYNASPGQDSSTNALGPMLLLWPVLPGVSYSVQFKDDLSDPAWQYLNGSAILIGNNGYEYDWSPSADHRFYRFILSD